MTRLVMGGVRSAELCDLTLKILAYAPHIPVTTTTHIDNLRFIGTKEAVVAVRELFLKNCAEVGATLNDEPENQPHQMGDFVGMSCDYSAGTVALTDKSRAKIRSKLLREIASPWNARHCSVLRSGAHRSEFPQRSPAAPRCSSSPTPASKDGAWLSVRPATRCRASESSGQRL